VVETAAAIDASRYASLIIRELVAVKPAEEVILIADTRTNMEMVYALAGQVAAVGAEFTIAIMPSRAEQDANRLSRVIERGLEGADVVIGLTRAAGAPTYHPTIVRLLREKRTRNLSMVMRDLKNWTQGGATADYAAMYQLARGLSHRWEQARRIHITTSLGTDLWLNVAGEEVFVECGYALEGGQEAAFSDGEVSQMPNEGSAEGVLVVDGPICHLGTPREPLRLIIRAGRLVEVVGTDRVAEQLRELIGRVLNADNIAELGLGLNPASLRNGDFEEEKKGLGNIHVALGSNIFYGGTTHSAVHMDMVIYGATVEFDGEPIMENGSLRWG